jgi:large subunit ribosomal protein L24
MKKEWSKKWSGSKQPRKQRKFRYNAPVNVRHKLVSVHLSKENRERFNKRSVPLRKGDEVKLVVGDKKGFKGNVERIDTKRYKVYVEGLNTKKIDGSEILIPVDPSNLIITKLNLDDKMRQKVFDRVRTKTAEPVKTEPEKTVPKPVQKPAAKPAAVKSEKPKIEAKEIKNAS